MLLFVFLWIVRQSSTVPLELAGEEAFPSGNLLIPGLQDLLLLHRGHGQAIGVGLVDVGPHPRQTGRVLHLPTHYAHQQVVEGVVIHEVAAPPRLVRNGTVLAIVACAKQKLWLVCGNSRGRCFARRCLQRLWHRACFKFTFDRCCVIRKGARVHVQQSAVNENDLCCDWLNLKAKLCWFRQNLPPYEMIWFLRGAPTLTKKQRKTNTMFNKDSPNIQWTRNRHLNERV